MPAKAEPELITSIALPEAVKIQSGLQTLREKIAAITVMDGDSYRAVLAEVDAGTDYIRDVKAKLGPGIESARRHLETLRDQMNAYIEPAQAIVDAGKRKATEWKAAEKRRADLEQQRLQDEEKKRRDEQAEKDRKARVEQAEIDRKKAVAEINAALRKGDISKRKAAELLKAAGANEEAAKALADAEAETAKAAPLPSIEVVPAIPKVARHADRTVWKWRMKQIDAVPRMFLYPNDLNDTANFPRITVEVKRIKDKAKAEAMIPGIEVFSEEGV